MVMIVCHGGGCGGILCSGDDCMSWWLYVVVVAVLEVMVIHVWQWGITYCMIIYVDGGCGL